VFEGRVYLGQGGLGSNGGPDIIAYKLDNGIERYAIGEAKDANGAGINDWDDFHKKTGWQGSRWSLCRLGGGSDFIGPLQRIYEKAYEIIQRIRDPVAPASYDVFYVYGSISSAMTVEARNTMSASDIDMVRGLLDNRGSFEVMLYELQNPKNPSPSNLPGENGSPSKTVVFNNYPHLWKLLD
jgi:hypothetical protein